MILSISPYYGYESCKLNVRSWLSSLEARGKSSKVMIILPCLCYPINDYDMLWKYVWCFYVDMLVYEQVFVRSWKEHDKCKLRYSLICFTQDDYLILISQTKG